MNPLFTKVKAVFSDGLHDLWVGTQKIAEATPKIEQQAAPIEAMTALIPVYGAEAAVIERLAFASLAEFAFLVQLHGGATKAAAANPTVDPQLLLKVEAVLQQNPQLVAKAAALLNVK